MPGSTIRVGNVEIIAILDTPMEFPWSAFFPNVGMSDFEPYRELYPECYGEKGFRTNASAYAVRSQGKIILCDTGLGPGPFDFLGGLEGHLIADMNTKGVQPEAVDIVAHSHLHADHVGWNLSPDNVPNFPNAMYYTPKEDWDFFKQAVESNPQMNQVIPLQELGRLELFSGELQLTDEVTAVPTPGHTPGHCSFVIASGGEKAVIMADLAHHPAQTERTEWCSHFDMNPDGAIDSRRKMFEQVEAEGSIAAFGHFPQPGFGRLVKVDGKRIFQAL